MSLHLAAITLIFALAGCTSAMHSEPASPANSVVQRPTGTLPQAPNRVRQGRYTLVSITPLEAQRDLLAQLIESRLPSTLQPTVQDALHHVLLRSGYGLCPSSEATQVLFSRPLAAVHYRLGPTPLRQALHVLAGPAWLLQVDEISRTVCFIQRPVDMPEPHRASDSTAALSQGHRL